VEQFNLDRLSFQPVYEESDDYISILVPELNGRSKYALEFIKYEKKAGRLSLVNPCACINTQCLELGYSSKGDHNRLIGCYREGLKLAALVMIRSGYSLRVDIDNSHWNFYFVNSEFRYIIRPSVERNTNALSNTTADVA